MSTIKQKKVFKLIVKNKGNISKSMREAGYADASAKNPKVVTQSKGWNELIKEYLPEEDLAKVHQEQLRAEKLQPIGGKTKVVKDNDARLRALDLGYKIHGLYAPKKISITDDNEDLTDDELEREISRELDKKQAAPKKAKSA